MPELKITDDTALDTVPQDTANQVLPEIEKLLSQGLAEDKNNTEEVVTEDENEELVGDNKDIRIPKRFTHETDTMHNMRVQIAIATEAKRNATTVEEIDLAKTRLKELRTGLAEQSKDINPVTTKPDDKLVFESQEQEDDVRIALKSLGLDSNELVKKSDVETLVNTMLAQKQAEQSEAQQNNAISNFFLSRPDIMADKFKQEALVTEVFEMFRITPQTSPEKLKYYFDLTATQLFPKKVINNTVQDKADLSNISGGSKSLNSSEAYTSEQIRQAQALGL